MMAWFFWSLLVILGLTEFILHVLRANRGR